MALDVTLDQVRAAHARIEASIHRTPLLAVPSDLHGREDVALYLKLECKQVSGSFKARGARNFLARAIESAAEVSGVVTYSSGNHGCAVAEAAGLFSLPALVTVPDHVDASKEAGIVAAGAEAVRAGATSESRKARALEVAAERGWLVIPPFDHEWIIEGQATALLEALDELPEPPVGAWVPVGGGGLAAGSAATLSARVPDATLHTVEPTGAAAYASARDAGKPVRLESAESVADGLLPLSVGDRNFEVLGRAKVQTHVVEDEAITANFRLLRLMLEVPCETSGAVSSAPIIVGDEEIEPGVHVAMVSGGNISDERLAKLLG
ncbi:MAG: pyridoxal-phosphate dependent enzyme [Planctomycetota bacterium]